MKQEKRYKVETDIKYMKALDDDAWDPVAPHKKFQVTTFCLQMVNHVTQNFHKIAPYNVISVCIFYWKYD